MKIKRRTVTVLLLSLILIAALFGCSNKKNTIEFPEAPADPIKLTNENFISELTKYCHSGASFYLYEDIVLTEDWSPIGQTVSTAFNGTLDGKGHSISGLHITGWEGDGTPVTISKRILGWKKDGTPVYRSSEVVSMKTHRTGEFKEVDEIIHEGEESDPDYIDMADSGVIEEETSFGSIGLFGYTYGAKITDLVIDGADFEFYGEGDNVYAGIISGYDIASEFSKIRLNDCKILASLIETLTVRYHVENAKPKSVAQENSMKQYLGGIVGYSRGNTVVNVVDNVFTTQTTTTVFDDIKVSNITIDNTNFSAVFNPQLKAVYSQYGDEDSKDYSILITELTDEEGFGAYEVNDNLKQPKQTFAGCVSGYSVDATIKNVDVDGFNKTVYFKNNDGFGSEKINVGGVSAALLGSESKAEKINVNNIDIYGQKIKTGAMIGGAFAEVKGGKVENDCNVTNAKFVVNGNLSAIETVCVGGFASYCDEGADLSDLNVQDVYLESNYIAESENLGSILAGIVGVLRDSTLGTSKAKGITFKVISNEYKESYYCFTRNAVSQVYGNSVVKGNVETIDCSYYKGQADTAEEYAVIKPIVTKNNYVNENGETSARLYYQVGGKTARIYVTVYGDLVPLMTDSRYRLREDTVYIALTDAQIEQMLSVDGRVPRDGTYYFYETTNGVWQNIHTKAGEGLATYNENTLYGLEKKVYRVELPSSEIGKAMTEGRYYTFAENQGKLVPATGEFKDETYYVLMEDADLIGEYEMDVTVYTESDKIIEAQKSGADNKETVTYSVPLSKYVEDVSVYDNDGTTVLNVKCPAEVYLDVYFKHGTGFLTSVDGYAVKNGPEETRNFAEYVLVDGRPNVDPAAITYKSTED